MFSRLADTFTRSLLTAANVPQRDTRREFFGRCASLCFAAFAGMAAMSKVAFARGCEILPAGPCGSVTLPGCPDCPEADPGNQHPCPDEWPITDEDSCGGELGSCQDYILWYECQNSCWCAYDISDCC
jgi:hypothetical protein